MDRFINEARVDVSGSFRKPSDARTETNSFLQRFRLIESISDELNSGHEPVVMISFDELYKKAVAAIDLVNYKNKYVSCVRITFGLNADNKIEFYYQPILVLNDGSVTQTGGYFTGRIATANNEGYYAYRNGNFEPIGSDQTRLPTVGNYRHRIRIKRYKKSKSYWSFLIDSDWTGDVQSVIFSFKELFELYKSNFQDLDPDMKLDQSIIPMNGAVLIDGTFLDIVRDRYKHTVLFKAKREDDKNVLYPITADPGDLANFAHLCPPRCFDISFKTL